MNKNLADWKAAHLDARGAARRNPGVAEFAMAERFAARKVREMERIAFGGPVRKPSSD
jgi:hypothetical protein